MRQIRKLPMSDARTIYREVTQLQEFPDCQNVKRLADHQYQYRLRVGQFRVLFNYDGDVRIVSIEEIKRRDENTY